MAYSPNDQGPELPRTTGRNRRAGLWLGLVALLLIAGIIWSQSSGSPGTDPSTTASTTQTTIPAPQPGTSDNTGQTPTQTAPTRQ